MPTKRPPLHTPPRRFHLARAAVYACLFIALWAVSFSALVVRPAQPISPTDSDVLAYATTMGREALLRRTNDERVKKGLQPLAIAAKLDAAAQAKADDMVARNYWSHDTPEGKKPWVFINGVDYRYENAGENLAYGFANEADATVGWMNSPLHRENVLGDYTEVGFGVANADDFNGSGPSTVVVAMYATPAAVGDNGDLIAANGVINLPSEQTGIVSALTVPSWRMAIAIGFVLIAAGVLIGMHLRHVRRAWEAGKRFALHHPIIDAIAIGMLITLLLTATSGYIL